MKSRDDGRCNKAATLVGEAMKYHPHGDASIKDALVQLGQKDLLIDCQGNWGNILTGDPAAAGRYIEARLTHPSPTKSCSIPNLQTGSTPTTAVTRSRSICR